MAARRFAPSVEWSGASLRCDGLSTELVIRLRAALDWASVAHFFSLPGSVPPAFERMIGARSTLGIPPLVCTWNVRLPKLASFPATFEPIALDDGDPAFRAMFATLIPTGRFSVWNQFRSRRSWIRHQLVYGLFSAAYLALLMRMTTTRSWSTAGGFSAVFVLFVIVTSWFRFGRGSGRGRARWFLVPGGLVKVPAKRDGRWPQPKIYSAQEHWLFAATRRTHVFDGQSYTRVDTSEEEAMACALAWRAAPEPPAAEMLRKWWAEYFPN